MCLLGLGVWMVFEGVLKVSGRYFDSFLRVSGRCVYGDLKVRCKCLKIFLQVSEGVERYLEGV